MSSTFNFRPILLLLGVALAVAVGVTVVLWWQGPNWSLLYGNLTDSDASEVVQALQTAGIQNKIDNASGAIMVPADQVHNARLKLAAQGLPASKSAGGIDLISKESSFGVSQFMESARYQYALENELARTISSMQYVEAARVHLAMAQQSAFVRDHKATTASVMLQLRTGHRLETEQVSAIVHLVASSIPDLDANDVTVVDQQGRLLSSPADTGSTISAERFQAAQRVEDSYVQRIEQLLTPLVGAGRVKAQVTVDLDANASEEAREQYKPEGAVVREEQSSESTTRGGAGGSGGIPGALSNQPPAGGVAVAATNPGATPAAATPPAATGAAGAAGAAGATAANAAAASAAAAAAASVPESSSKEMQKNYEIDRTLSYSRQPGGQIKRLTVAVLLDNVPVTDKDGKVRQQALSAAQLDSITQLVKNAVGFQESRGDSVNVVNSAFQTETETLVPEETPIWQRPWVLNIVRLALGAVVMLVLALVVLRPLIKNLTANSMMALPGPSLVAAGAGAGGNAAGGNNAGVTVDAGSVAPSGQSLAYEQQIVQARSLVAQDPKRVAQVVKQWVNE
ncbi:MAG TPA: flagellar basal-body MS-ring/collar protein FliF [Steroidobacteraceae bacterium]|nr:flagellar basal-body MS-ring/collar protein FliF [Steroidobacteraceae bacterium]